MSTPTVDGLDIHGQYQPVADWDQIPQYALMSVKATEGATYTQPKAKEYFLQFRRRAFRYRGIYHWFRPDTSAQSQFDNLKRFVDSLGGLQVGEFIQMDWERTGTLPMPSLAAALAFLQLCQQEWPERVCVYVSDWVDHFYEWLATNPVEPLWYANYSTTNPDSPTGGWAECAKYAADIWQFTSGFMSPGITTRCDANHIFNTAALEQLAGYPPATTPRAEATTPVDLPHVPYNHEEDEMSGSLQIISSIAYKEKLLQGAGTPIWLTGEEYGAYLAAGVPEVTSSDHPSFAVKAARAGCPGLTPR